MEGSPNIIAWLTLLSVPLFALYAFKRWPAQKAALMLVVGSAMFVPPVIGVNLPVLPDMDKEILPALSGLCACLLLARRKMKAKPFRGPEVLLLLAVVGAFGTIATNGDRLVYGPTVLPALTAYDGLVDSIRILTIWFPPFYLGRTLFTTRRDLHRLVRFMALAGLVYTIPIMLELRLSPQLNRWIYGFHQSEFAQTIRFGGYRPKVFMRHGLNVALFMTITVLAAATLYRTEGRLHRRFTPGRATVFLVLMLIACKSTGAVFYLLALLPLVLWGSVRAQLRAAMAGTTLILSYPLLRSAGMVPVDGIIEFMEQNINEERARSLWFRLFTEEQILENTRDRFMFGWGGYGRPFEFDPETGEMLTVVDGYWAIEIGNHGLIGFLCVFGLMLVPVVLAWRRIERIRSEQDQLLLCVLALSTTIYVFDWVPNSSISADLTFLTGALAGLVPGIIKEERRYARWMAAKAAQERAEENALPALQPPATPS